MGDPRSHLNAGNRLETGTSTLWPSGLKELAGHGEREALLASGLDAFLLPHRNGALAVNAGAGGAIHNALNAPSRVYMSGCICVRLR